MLTADESSILPILNYLETTLKDLKSKLIFQNIAVKFGVEDYDKKKSNG